MNRRRPLFLLEIVIAIVLVGFFSVYFLQSSLKQLSKERQGLLDLEYGWWSDLEKIKIIAEGWPKEGVFEQKKFRPEPYSVIFGSRTYSKAYVYELTLADESDTAFKLKLSEGQRKDGKITAKKNFYFMANKNSTVIP